MNASYCTSGGRHPTSEGLIFRMCWNSGVQAEGIKAEGGDVKCEMRAGTGSAVCGSACPRSSLLQTEDDSHPPFHFLDGALRQTPDLFAERFIGYRDQLSQQQVAITVQRPLSFAKAES